jgi:uncharacterized protein (DUF697 family)
MASAKRRKRARRDDYVEGERLLSAVERLVDDSDALIAHVEMLSSTLGTASEPASVEVVAEKLIADYSMRAAIAGGVTALPGLLPGSGSAVAVVGGALIDMTLMLKHEVELILCLTHLYGFDIRNEKERWLAYVLAGVRTHDVAHRQNYLADLLEIQMDALPKYTPRELFKLAATVLGKVALRTFPRGLVKAIPLIGIAVSASTNKFLTTNVGWWCVETLERRRLVPESELDVVDAVVR